jgi:hypothetical protein
MRLAVSVYFQQNNRRNCLSLADGERDRTDIRRFAVLPAHGEPCTMVFPAYSAGNDAIGIGCRSRRISCNLREFGVGWFFMIRSGPDLSRSERRESSRREIRERPPLDDALFIQENTTKHSTFVEPSRLHESFSCSGKRERELWPAG